MIPINKRNIGVCIILSFLTLGIYSIYWEYLLVKNIRAIKKDDSSCTGEILCLIFVPFYSLYWWFTRGRLIREEFSKHGFSVCSHETVFLFLALFGIGIVAMAIMQNDFNSLPNSYACSTQQGAFSERFKEIFRFCVNGGVCFLVDWATMLLLDRFVFPENLHWISIAAGFTLSVILNYILCVVWVFKGATKQDFKSKVIFVGSSVIGLLLTELFMFLLEKIMPAIIAKPIVTLIVMVWNYFMKRIALYGMKSKNE